MKGINRSHRIHNKAGKQLSSDRNVRSRRFSKRKSRRSNIDPKDTNSKLKILKLLGGTAVLLGILGLAAYKGYRDEEEASSPNVSSIPAREQKAEASGYTARMVPDTWSFDDQSTVNRSQKIDMQGQGEGWSSDLGDCREGLINPNLSIKFYWKEVGGRGDCLYLCLLAAIDIFDLHDEYTSRLDILKDLLNEFKIYFPGPEADMMHEVRNSSDKACELSGDIQVPSLLPMFKARYLRSLVVNSSQFAVNQPDPTITTQLQNLLKHPLRLYKLFLGQEDDLGDTLGLERDCNRAMSSGVLDGVLDIYVKDGLTDADLKFALFQLCIYDLVNSYGTQFGDCTPPNYDIRGIPDKGDYVWKLQLMDEWNRAHPNTPLPTEDADLLDKLKPLMLESYLDRGIANGRYGTDFDIAVFEIMTNVNVFLIQRANLEVENGRWHRRTAEIANQKYKERQKQKIEEIDITHQTLIRDASQGEVRESEESIAKSLNDLTQQKREYEARILKIEAAEEDMRSKPLILISFDLDDEHYQLAGLLASDENGENARIRTVFDPYTQFKFRVDQIWTIPQTIYEFLASDKSLSPNM